MIDTRVEDFYEEASDFEEVLDAAEENATSRNEMQFVDTLSIKWADYGMQTFLSDGQNDWLRRIAKV